MAMLFYSTGSEAGQADAWVDAVKSGVPGLEVWLFPELGDGAEIEYLLTWKPTGLEFAALPNLKAIFSLGAGVDHLLKLPDLPPDVPVVRLVDRLLTNQMTEYVVMSVLFHHRRMLDYRALQAEARWENLLPPDTEAATVGFLGLGVMARASLDVLKRFDFRLAGWGRTARAIDGVECYRGADGLTEMLARTDILVCLLPHTPETVGVISASTLGCLRPGAALINAGRGQAVIDADLLAALDAGRLSGATLDVFNDEPLPADHPYWRHPRVVVTPHVASETIPRSAGLAVAENIRRLEAGQSPIELVDRARGY